MTGGGGATLQFSTFVVRAVVSVLLREKKNKKIPSETQHTRTKPRRKSLYVKTFYKYYDEGALRQQPCETDANICGENSAAIVHR